LLRCTSCNTIIEPAANFCVRCGARTWPLCRQ
jgi:hypothetical protein